MTTKKRTGRKKTGTRVQKARKLHLVAEEVLNDLDPNKEVTPEQKETMLEMRDAIVEFLKPHPGRPQLELDAEQVEKLAAFFLSYEEIGHFFNVSADTIERNYAAAVKRGWSYGHASLKRRQFMRATIDGSDTMLIWMGKQHLGQTDKNDIQSGGRPLEGPRETNYFIIGGQKIAV